jgi:serine/threonine-protein kinase HipA
MSAKTIYVFYEDKRVGELRDFGDQTGFEYSPEFLASGHQLSPIEMPLRPGVFVKNHPSMECLPGIFSDSLPDSYGQRILKDWYAKKKGDTYIPTAADMLGYVGRNGMGALTYEPAQDEYDASLLKELDLAKAEREMRSYLEGKAEEVLESLRASAKTVGGSCPKALIALDPATGQTFEERGNLPINFEHWIVKFGSGDTRQRNDFRDYPEVEMAYLDMARDCGITVPEFRSFETTREDGKRLVHLGVRRFDMVDGKRLHYASLSGITGREPDFAYWSYNHLLEATQKVVADFRAIKEQCRRMIFNVASANTDDHSKNHGFLYDGKEWKIAPAFDLAYWGFRTNAPQALAVGAQARGITFATMKNFCEKAGIKASEIDEMGAQIHSVLERASSYFDKWNVPPEHSRVVVADLAKRMETSLAIKAVLSRSKSRASLPEASKESPK